MLAYSGRGKFQIVRCTVDELMDESRELWLSAIGPHCQLNVNVVDCSLLVEIDKGQIQQLLTNLIMNAAEAEAQTITIRSACQTISAEDSHYWQYTAQPLSPGNYILITVEDDGVGIESAMLEKIFDPFFTTKFTGRGLGLAAGLGIVRGHGGGVAVQSQPGVGTTFYILLPLVTEQELIFATTHNECSETLDRLKLHKILVIDDQSDVRETVAETLAHYQIQVVTCADGLSGIDYYTANKTEIDLVLLDLTMPGLNGLQVWQRLRTIEPTVKVILSSGYNTVDVLEWIEDPVEILQKPYHPEALVRALCKCFT
jgi:CheY-like chemotaxis protein